jgi:DNA invertase Pin-like site-specific DNA recombinase
MSPTTSAQRIVGLVRVSEVGDREGDSFASPGQQTDRIKAECDRNGGALLKVYEEMDVSGGRALDKRPGLSEAVAMVENGEADVIMAAYFDRLFRSLATQAEVVQRVEAAGGQVVALDSGAITNGTAAEWLNATLLGAMAEHTARTARERSGASVRRRVLDGIVPYPTLPLGYVRGADGRAEVVDDLRETIAEAFALRAAGQPYAKVRELLAEHGHELSYRSVQILLRSPLYVGELRHGETVNPTACEAIVERYVWDAVQRMRTTGGRAPKSERLLARLGVLRCASCGARMVAGGQTARWGDTTRRYAFYKCGMPGECSAPVTISADAVEAYIVDRVRAYAAGIEETTSANERARAAAAKVEAAQAKLDTALRRLMLVDAEGEAAAQEAVELLRVHRDKALAEAARLATVASGISISAAADWDRLTLAERREIIGAAVEAAYVARGRASVADRVAVELRELI